MTNTVHVALCSGGQDSVVATHAVMRWGPADLVVYLDTGTGLQKNREFVEDFADRYGWDLWTLRTPENYEERVEEHGFPGPSRHSIMYRTLKSRQLDRFATVTGGSDADLHFWTGVRAQESRRRMGHVEPEKEARRWTWHAPLASWSKEECRQYIERFDLPENPLWSTLGRSGDCFCGCYGSPEEVLDLRAAGCDERADYLRNLERQVDRDDERGTWAWGGLSDTERRAERVDDRQMTLCSSCGAGLPVDPDRDEDDTERQETLFSATRPEDTDVRQYTDGGRSE